MQDSIREILVSTKEKKLVMDKVLLASLYLMSMLFYPGNGVIMNAAEYQHDSINYVTSSDCIAK